MTTGRQKGNQIYFTKEHARMRRAVADFVKKEINPNVDQWEEDGIAPLHELFKKMGRLGFLGIRYDPRYGGQGLDLSLIHISEPTRLWSGSRMPSSA